MKYAEDHSKTSKAYRKFYNAMKTDSTISAYSYNMKRFMDFLTSYEEVKTNEDYDLLLEFDSEKITDLLEEFVASLNKSLKKTSSVKTMLAAPELFFEMNRKIWHKKLVRRGIKKDGQIKSGKLPATDEDIQRMLQVTKNLRDIAVIHFLASTGSRPAGIVDPVLRMKHLTEMPHKCYAVKIYDQYDEGYWAFLTPEASKALDDYVDERIYRGENITKESPVFVTREKRGKWDPDTLRPMTRITLHGLFLRLVNNSRIERFKTGNRFDKGEFLGFRKRFNTILKSDSDVNSNITEKLMAHKKGLDGVYFKPTREDCFREFRKAIPNLTLDEAEKLRLR